MQDTTCPVCGSQDINFFFHLTGVPVYCNVLWEDAQKALNAPVAEVQLGFCPHCNHIYNYKFDESKLHYTDEYENSLHFSQVFSSYAESLAKSLVEKYQLKEKTVVEIGCGKGDFLELLCNLGENKGIGFDPSFEPDRKRNGNFVVIKDYYSKKYNNIKADFICSRHTLEHIKDPREFLQNLRETLGPDRQPIVFFEVPNVALILEKLSVWDIIYEHCSYFSKDSLSNLFLITGFEVLNIHPSFGDQFLVIEAFPKKTSNKEPIRLTKDPGLELSVEKFPREFSNKLNQWENLLNRFKQQNKKVVIWGSGSKGVMFLNLMKEMDLIQWAVDINPHKQGRYIPGTGQKVVPPEFLLDYKPDVILIMNPIYVNEIQHIVHNLGLSPELVSM